MEHVLHHDPVRLALPDGPGGPANEAVDGVLLLRVVDRKLVAPSLELVAAVLHPVGPRDQHLPPAGRAHLIDPIAVDELAAGGGVRPEPAADLYDDGPLILERDLDLFAGRAGHGSYAVTFRSGEGCGLSLSSIRLRCASVKSSAIAGSTSTTATAKTISTLVRVALAAAPSAIVSFSGSR
jgi:hypothetical protein